jgi:hypothetical protein
MTIPPGQPERLTQDRIVTLFQAELGYQYLDNWQYRRENSHIEEKLLTTYLQERQYRQPLISKALQQLSKVAGDTLIYMCVPGALPRSANECLKSGTAKN